MRTGDPAMFQGTEAAGSALTAIDGLRIVVLSGEGRAFCPGLDMASFADLGDTADLATRSHGAANLFQHVAVPLLHAESTEQSALVGTPNQMEAVMANLQKRAPLFR
jgi:hypothetical protein